MDILMTSAAWIGGLFDYFSEALINHGHKVEHLKYERKKSFIRNLKLQNIRQINAYLDNISWHSFNQYVSNQYSHYQPDVFIAFNEAYLLPDTVKLMQSAGCTTAVFIGDNPFDSHRFSFFPITLKYYNIILVSDRIWIPSIRNVAPKSKIVKVVSGGGFSERQFYPVDCDKITENDRKELSCDISFTGESYGMRAEGIYRAEIIDQLSKYNLKIWGDKDWQLRFAYYRNIEKAYQGGRLPFDKLRKLYRLSNINLNMPSPQCLTGFQPRLFEIAACKGFQIVDWREELDEIFSAEELVTFKNTDELEDKIDFYLKNPVERQPFVEKLFKKVRKKYKWENLIEEILPVLQGAVPCYLIISLIYSGLFKWY